MMRLSLPVHLNDFLGFLLFLRLGAVAFGCAIAPLLIAKTYGPGFGLAACSAAYPFWWYHFGLPRFKEQRTGLFSATFCLWGYIIMTVALSVCALEYMGILKEATGKPPAQPQDFFSTKHMVRVLVIFGVLCLYAYFKGVLFKRNNK